MYKRVMLSTEPRLNLSALSYACDQVRPKMGKLTIDYQKLHDAFFK